MPLPGHPVGKGIGVGKGAGIVEGATAEEDIVLLAAVLPLQVVLPAFTVRPPERSCQHRRSWPSAIKCGSGSTRNGAAGPVGPAANGGTRAGQGAPGKQEVRGIAPTVEIDRTTAYLKGTRPAGGHGVQIMSAGVEIQGGAAGHGEAAAVGAIRFQAQSSGIDIDRAGIVEGDAYTSVSVLFCLL